MKIKKGDNVKILSGKDRGKTGKVIVVFPKEGRLTVEGINMMVRHRRSKRQGQKGEKVRVAMPIDASNAQVICESCKSSARVGFKIDENGKKIRICKKCASAL
ncbi:MAG: 50S ribosomal protein L24 [Patescibacteria group bacterium]